MCEAPITIPKISDMIATETRLFGSPDIAVKAVSRFKVNQRFDECSKTLVRNIYSVAYSSWFARSSRSVSIILASTIVAPLP
jgi:hypothetical protein